MEQTVQSAFLAMRDAYYKFVRASEELKKTNRERVMNLPPTLGKNDKHQQQ